MNWHTINENQFEKFKKQEARLEQLEVALSVAEEALVWSDEMFTARDEMNSKVHCAPVRLSPITERVKQALAKIAETRRGE